MENRGTAWDSCRSDTRFPSDLIAKGLDGPRSRTTNPALRASSCMWSSSVQEGQGWELRDLVTDKAYGSSRGQSH